VNNITLDSTFWWYEDMIRIYADFLFKKVSKQEASADMRIIEKRWAKLDYMCKKLVEDPSAFTIMVLKPRYYDVRKPF